MLHRRFTRCASTVVTTTVIGAFGFAVSPPAAAALHLEQYVEVAQCQPATGQDCPQRPEVKFTGDQKSIALQYTSNANGCSDALFRFNVDNYPQTDWLKDSPGQTITAQIGVHPGDHVLSVSARGIEGGCNTGILSAWGGTVRLDTADDVGPAPVKTPCKWTLKGGGNIMRGNDLRFTFASWHDNTPIGPFRMYQPNKTVLLDHGSILYSTGEGDKVDFGISWFDERNQPWRNDWYVGTFDPSNGTLRGTVTSSDGSASTDWAVNEFFTCQ